MAPPQPLALCPAQKHALDGLLEALPIGNVLVLYGETGMGKTTVLREFHRRAGGVFLTIKDFVDAMQHRHPLALEECFEQLLLKELQANDIVILDDFQLIECVAGGCSGAYPRRGFLDAPLTSLAAYVVESEKKLVLGHDGSPSTPIYQRTFFSGIGEFKVEDYAALCRAYLDSAVELLDFKKIHRFAPKLNAHQLRATCLWLRGHSEWEQQATEAFIEFLRSKHLVSNVDLGEVQPVDLRDLKGVDDVLERLEASIVLPLENDALATELELKPKRGVLLVGPPGTGKTTVGRALAHRLRSKFFLLDGTMISGTGDFYNRVHRLFEAAKQNAPSILFIDDTDAIFESGEELGLYRYLLTMLDGLESESAGRICVMMTAMDVGNLPPALVRSGRIELWLEMSLPNEEARDAILREHLKRLPASVGQVDVPPLVVATDGFTGADLKRLVEDGKGLFAYDKARGLPLRPPTDYFLAAVEAVRSNREKYAAADARARQQRPTRPSFFDAALSRAFAAMSEA